MQVSHIMTAFNLTDFEGFIVLFEYFIEKSVYFRKKSLHMQLLLQEIYISLWHFDWTILKELLFFLTFKYFIKQFIFSSPPTF